MFPERGDASVGQGIVAVGLVLLVQRDERVVAVCLFHPLHSVAGIGQYLLASLSGSLVGLGVVRENFSRFSRLSRFSRISRITRIQIDEVDRSEGAVFPDLTNHTPYAITVIGVVLLVKGYAIVSDSPKLSALRNIPAYTLVHDGY